MGKYYRASPGREQHTKAIINALVKNGLLKDDETPILREVKEMIYSGDVGTEINLIKDIDLFGMLKREIEGK